MNPFTVMAIIAEAMKVIPQVIVAIQQIMASDQAKTIGSAVQDVIHHLTPGDRNAPELSPTATPLVPTATQVASTSAQAIDFQAPKE